MKKIIYIIIIVALLVGGFYAFNSYIYNEKQADAPALSLDSKTWTWTEALLNDGSKVVPKREAAFTLAFAPDGTFSATTDCNRVFGGYEASGGRISFSGIGMTKMFCEGSQEDVFAAYLRDASEYLLTSKGELVLGLKFDSGSVIFK